MTLTVLGTATPYPRPDQPCSGYLVQHGETALWMDAGPGTLAELQRHCPLEALSGVWVSHSHADHSADLLAAYYALRFSALKPSFPLPLVAPTGLIERLEAFLGPNAPATLPTVFDLVEMRGWGESALGGLGLEWGPVDHGTPASGLRVTAGGATLAYSGDTAPCTSLVELADGADLLLCEVGYDNAPVDSPAVHCTPENAGTMASRAGVKRLLLTHLAETLTHEQAVDRAATAFDGPIEVATSGLAVTV